MDQTRDRNDWLIAAALVLGGLVVLVATVDDFGLTWDEPTYLDQTLSYLDYFKSLRGEKALDWSELPVLFKTKDRHPPLHRCLALPGLAGLPGQPRLLVARGATMALSALLLGVVYLWGRRGLSRPAALGAALLLLFVPRFFVHAHLFALDAAMAFWWTVVLWLFYEGRSAWKVWIGACVAFTGALLTKFTAVLLPVALLCWIMICRYAFRGKRALSQKTLLDWILKLYLMTMLGVAAFLCLWPQFWSEFRFHVLNYITFQMGHFNAGVQYLGDLYGGDRIPPWHYPWVLLFLTLTPAHLILLLAGAWGAVRRRWDGWLALVAVAALFPLLLFSAPNVPKYDGVRLFLNAFPALALIMGLGLDTLFDGLTRMSQRLRISRWKPAAPWVIAGLIVLSAVGSVARAHPYQLSYYNVLVGGLKGADRLGMTVTYWGEILDSIYPQINPLLRSGDGLLVEGTYGNPDYPHTTTDCVGDAHHLRPDIRLGKLEAAESIASTTGARRFLLVVERKGSIPEEVIRIQSQSTPIYAFVLDEVPLARLYCLSASATDSMEKDTPQSESSERKLDRRQQD